MYPMLNILGVHHIEHANDAAIDKYDSELYLFCGCNSQRDNNGEIWMQCIRCFHWDYNLGYALGVSRVKDKEN